MSEYRKKRIQELRRKIEQTNKSMVKAATLQEHEEANAAELYEIGFLEEDLNVLETLELQEQAKSFGIELIPDNTGYIKGTDYWDKTRDGRTCLTERGMTVAKNRIIDARLAYWKRWIDIVTPIVSIIFSVIALLIAALALYLQASSDPIIIVPPQR